MDLSEGDQGITVGRAAQGPVTAADAKRSGEFTGENGEFTRGNWSLSRENWVNWGELG